MSGSFFPRELGGAVDTGDGSGTLEKVGGEVWDLGATRTLAISG
jgi:hypothetical protein